MLIPDDFTTLALLSGGLVALLCSYLGMFVVLRRIVFVGASLAQASSAGVALATFMAWPPMVGAILAMLVGVGIFSHDPPRRRIPGESVVGAAYAAAGAAGVLFMAFAPQGEADMMHLFFGNILGVTPGEIGVMAGLFALLALVHALFAKEFLLVAFDPDMAQTLGYRVPAWNFLFFLTLGTALAVAVHAAGVLLVFSMLVFPPLVGLQASRSWRPACVASVLSALVSVAVGVWVSLRWDLPTGAAIVMAACGLFLAASGVRALRRG